MYKANVPGRFDNCRITKHGDTYAINDLTYGDGMGVLPGWGRGGPILYGPWTWDRYHGWTTRNPRLAHSTADRLHIPMA